MKAAQRQHVAQLRQRPAQDGHSGLAHLQHGVSAAGHALGQRGREVHDQLQAHVAAVRAPVLLHAAVGRVAAAQVEQAVNIACVPTVVQEFMSFQLWPDFSRPSS